MVAATAEKSRPLWMERLDTPAYRVTDAARYAGLRRDAISEWFRRSGPELPHRKRGLPLSYLELIEIAFVASFRSLSVPMCDIRRFKDRLKKVLETEYPFSTLEFRSRGIACLVESSDGLGADPINRLVKISSVRYISWHPVVGDRFAQFDYEYSMVIRWHLAGRQYRVTVDPRFAFGSPMVSGLPTWVIKGRTKAGYSIHEISSEYEIEEVAVRHALAFEESVPDW